MDIRANIITNAVSVAILLILAYAARSKSIRDRTEDKLYSFMIFGVMLGSVAEAFSYVLDGKLFPGARALNYFINTFIYSANMLLPFFLLIYVDLSFYGRTSRIWRNYKPQIIIGVIMVALNIVNFFVPVIYVITENNVYERKLLSYLYYVVIIYYFMSIFFLLRRYKKENGARSFVSFGMFLVPVIVGIGLQFMFYGLSLAWLSSAIGLVGLFMMQQNELAFIDPLMRIYNRQYMDYIISSWIKKNRSFVGAMLDIDRFKFINDTYGHTTGDIALKTLAEIFKQSGDGRELLFRFAGDEFIVLKITDSPDGLDGFLEDVNNRIAEFNSADNPYKLSLSYGTGFFSNGDIDTFIKEMDSDMYKMKEEHHKNSDNNSLGNL
ncbi:MAG: diguanylate cyclase [Clostridia bacterium]|nr:diguanylate cyclase [Clostridia bacterium]